MAGSSALVIDTLLSRAVHLPFQSGDAASQDALDGATVELFEDPDPNLFSLLCGFVWTMLRG